MPNRFRIRDAFHVDREAAKIAHWDDSKRVVDFHALRHTFITSLANGGVHPKTAQMLARHSDINMTMSRYTHSLRGAEAAALSALPDYSVPAVGEAKKTGTDDAPVGGGNGGGVPPGKSGAQSGAQLGKRMAKMRQQKTYRQ
jgi:hypothetical protein